MRVWVSALSLVAALGVVACSSSDSPADGSGGTAGFAGGANKGEARSSLVRDTAPVVPVADQTAVVADENSFAFALFGEVLKDPAYTSKNVVLSPLSISDALAMTSAGAQGATQSEMAGALHWSLPQDRLHTANNWLSLQLAQRTAQATATLQTLEVDPVPPMSFSVVNALFAQSDFAFGGPFLDTLAVNYGAGVTLEDFKTNPEGGRLDINTWVGNQTEQRIQDLLPEGAITVDTRLVLVNAIDVTAPWLSPFEESATSDAAFTKGDGSTVTVPYLHQTASYRFVENADLTLAAMNVMADKLSVVVVMPKAGGSLAQLESSFTSDSLTQLLGQSLVLPVQIALPKFKVTTESVSLKKPLEAMGMQVAFTELADFSPMTTVEPVHVDDVIHKAMIGFDEKGVQAAAATAVVVAGNTSVGPDPVPFVVDHPFLVGIIDNDTGLVLFWGQIVDPS